MHEMHSFEVVEEVGNVQCVTEHPGFEPVCLNKWCRGCQQPSIKQKEEQGTVEQDLKIGKEMISQVTLYTTFQLQIVTKG